MSRNRSSAKVISVSTSLHQTSQVSAVVPRTREFPNPIAIFNDRLVFTTLTSREVAAHSRIPYTHPKNGLICHLFTLDDKMTYTSFAMDHGPLNLAMTFEACIELHDLLDAKSLANKAICLYTGPEATMKSNMTLMIALYFLIVVRRSPWLAFQPVAQFEVMPFRDAGSGDMDYGLSIQDCLYGMDKAIQHGLVNLAEFDPTFYKYYETVENGDLNLLGPFIPFASPIEPAWIKALENATVKTKSPKGTVKTTIIPFDRPVAKTRSLTHRFKSVLDVFEKEKVGVVVRCNDELYDRRHFLNRGMDHVDLYFDDGTNPSDSIVREFIRLAEETIEKRKLRVAVHCKAGLGRTGVLIGAYLIYKYQFSAQEVIGFMRIVRPGMVVGPQQQYMAMNQMKWAGWAVRDQVLREIAAEAQNKEPVNPLATPPIDVDLPLFDAAPVPLVGDTNEKVVGLMDPELLESNIKPPVRKVSSDTPHQLHSVRGGDAAGQPRKTPARPKGYLEITTPEPSDDIAITNEPASPSPVANIRIEQHSIQLESYRSLPDVIPSSTPVSPTTGSGSLRGTKRGAASRTPLPRTSSTNTVESSSSRNILSIPPATLGLLHSNASTFSLSSEGGEERPAKRRVGNGTGLPPLNSAHELTGLSSPPPSRETSPAECDQLIPVSQEMVVGSEKMSSKLRKLAHPAATYSSNHGMMTAEIKQVSPSRIPARKSFLPVRKEAIVETTITTSRRSVLVTNTSKTNSVTATGAASKGARKPDEGNVAAAIRGTAEERRVTRRVIGLATPRFATELWGQIGRMTSSSPPTS